VAVPDPALPATQHPSERFTGGIEIGEQRMEPEPLLPRRRRLLFVRMRPDEVASMSIT
jgi:hypothetical protein